MIDPKTPVLVGAGQITQKGVAFAQAKSPLDLMEVAARRALADAGASGDLIAALDTVAVIRFIADSTEGTRFALATYRDPPASLAKRLGAKPQQRIYTSVGGNTPQALVNHLCEQIAAGEVKAALIGAGEALETMIAAAKAGEPVQWQEDLGSDPQSFGIDKPGHNAYERAHNMHVPANVYPLFENAIRGAKGRTVADHQMAMGRLFAPFTEVAAKNEHAWFQQARTAEEIALVSERNRMVGFPYPKFLNAMIFVDMAAAVILTSYGEAMRLGVPEDRLVYLHGCGEAHDIWYASERVNFHSSPAIRESATSTFAMANKTLSDVRHIDLYSCFPSAVEIGMAEIGIGEDDPRPLTVTGGLPYFGGPGNNYVLHSIATMMERLRRDRGSFGLVTANGWYVTKHAIGLYSTTPTKGPWRREDPAQIQGRVDAVKGPNVVESADGPAKVETYTVVHTHKGAAFGIVVARRNADHARVLSLVDRDSGLLPAMEQDDWLNKSGVISAGQGHNIFTPV